jgi:peptide subunit release factor 1 (eRF1)
MKDDVIVWSQDLKCSHIYHKECMVNYLASNAQRKSILNVCDNPCPTCRQNYCTVKDEDLVKLMIQKAATSTASTVIITTTTTTTAAATTSSYPYPPLTTTAMSDVALVVELEEV